ncbi:sensor histidine kinase [Gemella sanguinis]|jgi:integral membrane sensor signal transduction histidine kinase|uniref:sensor histidine kinase n=1 Tax=Gemella sanguinis TaxID=84135 RepID=UPI0004E259D3|nr:sensor histidine kinase [Gemella sanguinis]NKZ26492.1 HAMP domain-containing histidine kinase [Gemella sanguinis]
MDIIKSYIKKNLKIYLLLIVFIFIFVLIFYLYNLPFESLFYGGLLCFLVSLIASIIDYNNYRKSYIDLKYLETNILSSMEDLPKSLDIRVEYYQKIIERLHNEVERLKIEDNKKMEDLADYYSMWIHQIKTPIAAMNFLLDNEETDVKVFKQELFKIERYVEMVLTYIRLGSETSDYVITSIDLDEVVRENIKKYATLFINKKIKLNYVSHETYVISDKKWLGFAFEQLLSNAIKYTKSGGEISINISESELIIEDNGIGIYEEDLPRIFEQSFTGLNGRYEKKSSGLGLYLCKKTLDKLQHKIEITSEVNKGTKVKVSFPKKDIFRD